MSVTESQDIFATAAEMAKQLGMRRKKDMSSLKYGQTVIMVTESEITTGYIRSTHGQENDHRYDIYILENTTLCSYTFHRLPGSTDEEPAWEETPTIEMTLPEGAVLYAGRAPKDTRKSTRKSSTRY
jgi:hypothetical protein